MIDMETVKFVMMIDALCELSINGIRPISELESATEAENCVYFDDNTSVFNSLTNEYMYRAVSIALNDDEYDETENVYWDEYIETSSRYSVVVCVPEDDDPYVVVKCGGQAFYIQDGDCISS